MGESDTYDFTADEYREFLDGLGIGGVRLESSQSECSVWRLPSEEGNVEALPSFDVLSCHQFEDKSGFMAMARAGVVFNANEEFAGRVVATFVIVYTTEIPPNDRMLEAFIDGNLALHIWPYARELIQNTVSRFGWTPYALPLFVSG